MTTGEPLLEILRIKSWQQLRMRFDQPYRHDAKFLLHNQCVSSVTKIWTTDPNHELLLSINRHFGSEIHTNCDSRFFRGVPIPNFCYAPCVQTLCNNNLDHRPRSLLPYQIIAGGLGKNQIFVTLSQIFVTLPNFCYAFSNFCQIFVTLYFSIYFSQIFVTLYFFNLFSLLSNN